jgi:hypothetical protein
VEFRAKFLQDSTDETIATACGVSDITTASAERLSGAETAVSFHAAHAKAIIVTIDAS